MRRFKELRKLLGLSQEEAAIAFGGHSVSSVSAWENQTRRIPEDAWKMLSDLGVNHAWLFHGTGTMLLPGIKLEVHRKPEGIEIRKVPSPEGWGLVSEPTHDYAPHIIEFDGPGWMPQIPGQNHPGGVSLGYWGEDQQFHLIDSVAQAIESAALWFEEETANRPTIDPKKKARIIRMIAEELIECSARGGENIEVFTRLREGVRRKLRELLTLAG